MQKHCSSSQCGAICKQPFKIPQWEPTVEAVVLGVTLGDMSPLHKASTIFPLLMLLHEIPQPQGLSGLLVNQISNGSTQHREASDMAESMVTC